MKGIIQWLGTNSFYVQILAELAIYPIVMAFIYNRQFDRVIHSRSKGDKTINGFMFGVILFGVELAILLICLSVTLLDE